MAHYQVKLKHFEAAKELLQQLLREDPKSADALNLMGVCGARTGHMEEARKFFERAIELDGSLASAYVNLGNLLLANHDEAEALRRFKAALAIDPLILSRDPNAYTSFNTWGLCLMDGRKYSQASRAFQRSIRINPKFAPAHVNLGNALEALSHEDAALKEFLAAAALEPKDYLARYDAGLIYARRGKLDLAARFMRQAHEIAPNDKAVALALIGVELKLGNESEAEKILDGVGGPASLDASAREALAEVWLKNGDPDQAAKIADQDAVLARRLYQLGYDQAEEDVDRGRYAEATKILEAIRDLQRTDASFHDLLGSIYYALESPERASDEFQTALRMEPAEPDHYYKLGMLFLKHGRPDAAIYIFETATKIRPDVPKLWLGLGLGYYFGSKFDRAEKPLRVALMLDPQYQTAYVVLGDMLEQSGRADDSVEVLGKAIDLRPDWYLPYYYYGKIALRRGQGKIESVIAALEKAISLNPGFAEAHCELGKALARVGRIQESLGELQKSLKLKPDLAQSHYHLGVIYRQLGDQARATRQFRLFEANNKKQNPNELIQWVQVPNEKR